MVHMRIADDFFDRKMDGGVLWQKIKRKNEFAVIDITEEYLKERIYEIRGQRVILDADLSEIYGYTTKAFNQQVKNNIEKFDEDFMFELTDEELEDLRYKNCDRKY